MEYGVNISNKFAFLSGDEDNQDTDELIAKAQLANKEKASALKKEAAKKVQFTEKKPPANAPAVNANSVNKENVDNRRPPRRDGPPRQFNGPDRRNHVRGPPRKTDENGAPVPQGGDAQRPPRQFNRPPRDGQPPRRFPPRPRVEGEEGNNNNINNNNNFAENRPAPRDNRFNNRRGPPRSDRVSGSDKTGVRPFPKKDGAGRGNWGTEADELAAANDGANAADASPNANEPNANAEHTEGENAEQTVETPAEHQIRELTLEEWKAQHKTEPPKFNIRKPGEDAAEKKIYQKLVPIKRADYEKSEAKTTEEVQVKREPREKALNIEVSFNSSQRRGGGGGGRYRGEGGDREDRGGYRGERRGPPNAGGSGGNYRRGPGGGNAGGDRRGNAPQFNLAQESFPALGAR